MPTEAPLRRDAAANRERIVTAARRLFAEHGLETSMDEVARAAGVGSGTLYRRFPTKESLLDAILAETVERIHALASSALEHDAPLDGLARFLERALELEVENRALTQVLFLRLPEAPQLAGVRREIRALLEELVRRAQEDGSLRADVTAGDLQVLFWQLGRVVETTGTIDPDLWRRYLALVLDGLRATAGAPLPHPAPTRAQLDRAMTEAARRHGLHGRRRS